MSTNEKDLAREQMEAYLAARDAGHAEYVQDAKRYNNYYVGDQWSDADAEKLAKQGRPALTINEVLPTINTMVGEYTQRRADFAYKPAKNATAEVATALTKLVQHVTAVEQYDHKEGMVVTDGFIEERGWFDVRISFDNNILGEIVITTDDPADVIPDPRARQYDPRTWNELWFTRWLTLDEVELYYGKAKRAELEYLGVSGPAYGSDSVEMRATFGDPDAAENSASIVSAEKNVQRVRVIERQFKKLATQAFFVDMETGETKAVPEGWDEGKVAAFAERMQLGVHRKLTQRIRWRVTCDSVLLHDAWSPYRTFTKIPYFPYFRRGKPFGVVRNLMSPQDMLNKVSSQELHVVNTTANSGWNVEEGSLVNMDENELEQRGAETGLVLVHRKGTEKPEKIQPNQIPTGLDRISAKASNNMRRISGVNESMLGIDKAEVSGVAMQQKQNRGFVQLEVPFDNLAYTRQILSAKLLELLQDFYTEGRVYVITDFADPTHPSEELAINQMTPEGTIVNDLTVGEYQVVMSTMPARDTFDDSQFAEALQLREIGVMIPDDFIVQYSHLTKKGELAQEIRNATGRGELTPEQAEQAAVAADIQMRTLLAELAQIDAKTEQYQSQAALNAAKAQELMNPQPETPGAPAPDDSGLRVVELQAERENLMATLAAERENVLDKLRVQMAIARMADETKRRTAAATAMTAHAQMRFDSFNKRVDADSRVKIAASRPAPAAKSGRQTASKRT